MLGLDRLSGDEFCIAAPIAERNEFELIYQPQLHLADGRLIGAEALIRWRHPVRGLVSPAEFMPVVNTSTIFDPDRRMGAGNRLRQGRGAQALARTGLRPTSLEFEFTEDILLLDEQGARNTFLKIQERGQLGLSVIAEGIENRATADFLVSMGCEEGQGYFFGRPMPASDFEAKFLTASAKAAEVA